MFSIQSLANYSKINYFCSLVEKECPKCLSVADFEALFDENINCTSYCKYAIFTPMTVFYVRYQR